MKKIEASAVRARIKEFVENTNSGSSKTPYKIVLAKHSELFKYDILLNELEYEEVPSGKQERRMYYTRIRNIAKEVDRVILS